MTKVFLIILIVCLMLRLEGFLKICVDYFMFFVFIKNVEILLKNIPCPQNPTENQNHSEILSNESPKMLSQICVFLVKESGVVILVHKMWYLYDICPGMIIIHF